MPSGTGVFMKTGTLAQVHSRVNTGEVREPLGFYMSLNANDQVIAWSREHLNSLPTASGGVLC